MASKTTLAERRLRIAVEDLGAWDPDEFAFRVPDNRLQIDRELGRTARAFRFYTAEARRLDSAIVEVVDRFGDQGLRIESIGTYRRSEDDLLGFRFTLGLA